MNEREAFEAYSKRRLIPFNLDNPLGDEYLQPRTQWAWEIWGIAFNEGRRYKDAQHKPYSCWINTNKRRVTMLSFHNDQAVKQKYLDRVIAHQKADNLIRGTGWENGKGCTLESYDHSHYPIELGLPEWLAKLEDTLFEGMSKEKSCTFPMTFLKAIPLGISEHILETKVKAPFLVIVLDSLEGTYDKEKFPDVAEAIERSKALWLNDDIGSDDWNKEATGAAWAARATAEAAWAARATAEAAEAAGAAGAAWAAWAAWATAGAAEAAWATAGATWATAGATKFDYFTDELLRLLSELGKYKGGA